MTVKAIVASALTLTIAAPAAAADRLPCGAGLVCASSPQSVLEVMRTLDKTAKVEPSDTKDPKIEMKSSEGLTYTVYFEDCDDGNTSCGSLNFRSTFSASKWGTLAHVNQFNLNKRMIKASLLKDMGQQLDYDLSTVAGVSRANFVDLAKWWEQMLGEYSSYDPEGLKDD